MRTAPVSISGLNKQVNKAAAGHSALGSSRSFSPGQQQSSTCDMNGPGNVLRERTQAQSPHIMRFCLQGVSGIESPQNRGQTEPSLRLGVKKKGGNY